MPTIQDLKRQRDELEPHVSVFGDCKRAMFLGDCPKCARYYKLEDQISAIELANPAARAAGGDDGA